MLIGCILLFPASCSQATCRAAAASPSAANSNGLTTRPSQNGLFHPFSPCRTETSNWNADSTESAGGAPRWGSQQVADRGGSGVEGGRVGAELERIRTRAQADEDGLADRVVVQELDAV